MSKRVTKAILQDQIAALQDFGACDFVFVKPFAALRLGENVDFTPVCQYPSYLHPRIGEIGTIKTTRYFLGDSK